ncbi:recombinase RecT [Streptomyces sp. NPDC058664]|uniref:recombinase RecT n=1 Tax=unclassified Streptomyces TaxID=2593676 RepID=UPI003656D463
MTAELAIFQPGALNAQMDYAKAMAASDLLPRQYQGKPANLLWAISYGQTLGVAPLTAVQSIHVINGKPTASADLIAGLVRRAGHKLRVNGDDKKAVAQIIRADDPEFTFEVVWTIERAQAAKLTSKDTWKNFPAAMLKARAITEVARAACSEILQGTIYTPEELGANVDADGLPIEAPVQQLRAVQQGEPDPWADVDNWVKQAITISEAAEKATNPTTIRDLYRQARNEKLLTTTVLVQLNSEERSMELGAFLVARGKELAVPAPEPEVVEGVIVEDVELPADEHAAAVAAFRAFTAEHGISDADADKQAYAALGAPLADVAPKAIWDLLSQLTAAA